MELTWTHLTTLEPALTALEAEVIARAAARLGGADRWFAPLWYGDQGECSVRDALCALVGDDRGEPTASLFTDSFEATTGDWRLAPHPADTADEAMLRGGHAYDVACQHLADLLVRELNTSPLPVGLPAAPGWRAWRLAQPRQALVVDDRIAAAAALLELTGDVLLVAIAERRREGDTRLVHALFAPDGRLLAWDPLSAAGDPRAANFKPGLRLGVAEQLRADGGYWQRQLWTQLRSLNRAWLGDETPGGRPGYADGQSAELALRGLHRWGGCGSIPTWIRAGVEHEIVGIAQVDTHPGCPQCEAALSWCANRLQGS